MKQLYEQSVFEKIRKELKIENDLGFELKVKKTGGKITTDGIEYFDSIVEVDIYYRFTKIAYYNITNKNLYSLKRTGNVEASKALIKLINNYLGYEKYIMNEKVLKEFELFKDNLDEGLSAYEAAEMFGLYKKGLINVDFFA